ncbi:MAG: multiple antibiotic resistance protein [Sneathiella sp.]|jgi:multiple antibiotic resistance protein
MSPFLILPIFLAMTNKETVKQQRIIAVQTVLFCSILCIVVAYAGHNIIGFLGITVDHFRIAGGIVLFGIAFSMLNGREISPHRNPGSCAVVAPRSSCGSTDLSGVS